MLRIEDSLQLLIFFLQKSSLSWFLQSMSVYRVIFFSLIPRYGYFTPRNHLFNQMNTDFMPWNSWPLLSHKKWALGGVSNPFKCHKSRRINLVAVIICFSSNVRKIEWCSFKSHQTTLPWSLFRMSNNGKHLVIQWADNTLSAHFIHFVSKIVINFDIYFCAGILRRFGFVLRRNVYEAVAWKLLLLLNNSNRNARI